MNSQGAFIREVRVIAWGKSLDQPNPGAPGVPAPIGSGQKIVGTIRVSILALVLSGVLYIRDLSSERKFDYW